MTDDVPVRGAWARERDTVVLHPVDGPRTVDDPFSIHAQSAFSSVPLEFAPHAHPLHELVWVRGGTMTVHLASSVTTVPEGHGLWIPATTTHSGRTTANTRLSDAHFDTVRSRVTFARPTAIAITPVLGSLLSYLEDPGLTTDERLRAESVVFDVLRPADEEFSLQVPLDRTIGPIVAALLDDPVDDRTLSDWAQVIGTSERTIARSFRSHTGLSFVQWRQALRVHRAIALLADGLPVHEVSELIGYAQPSTFIATFKRVVGATPGSFVRD